MTFVLISHFLPTNFLLINVINSQSLPTDYWGNLKFRYRFTITIFAIKMLSNHEYCDSQLYRYI